MKNIAEEIHRKTGYSPDDITNILKSLGDVVKDKVSDGDNVEIKLFPGLKVTSKHIPPEQFHSNLGISNMKSILILNAEFSKHFKQKIKDKHGFD